MAKSNQVAAAVIAIQATAFFLWICMQLDYGEFVAWFEPSPRTAWWINAGFVALAVLVPALGVVEAPLPSRAAKPGQRDGRDD